MVSSSPSDTSNPPPPGAHVIVVTADMFGPLTVALHDVIDVELVSTDHGPHGVLVPWHTPTSSDPVVLTPDELTGLPSCPAQATCTAFDAAALGVAKVQTVGPSGWICDDNGAHCVGADALEYELSVTVAPAT